MNMCLSPELVGRYAAGSCTADERLRVENHVAACETCRDKVAASGLGEKTVTFAEDEASSSDAPTMNGVDRDQARTQSVPSPGQSGSGASIPTRATDTMFENYDIVEELPRGGQAVVYKAVHKATKTHVAIKVLLPSLLASARARYYFEREADLIAGLDHPNIVKIRDSGIFHGQYYFVMEYIQGLSLEEYVKSRELSFRERIVLFKQVCEAISYAHQQGIIHRDLKSGNILVDVRGAPHVLDFGLAKAVSLSEDDKKNAMPTLVGQLAGTISHMSPEQAAGQPGLIDVRTDVYSLGLILYHLLTGEYPYDVRGSTLEALQNIQRTEPVRPRQIIRKFDSDIEAILLAALAKDRAQRYQSVSDLMGDIENWLEGRVIRVRSISTAYLLRKIIVRHRFTSAVLGLLLLIILSFSYVSFDLYMTAKKAQKESEATALGWAAEARQSLALARQIVFTWFLDKWHENQEGESTLIVGILARGTKEQKAAAFLVNPASLGEKEDAFRRSVSQEDSWFADFVVGEHYLKAGEQAEAVDHYRRSYEAVKSSLQEGKLLGDKWLVKQVEGRLRQFDDPAGADGQSLSILSGEQQR